MKIKLILVLEEADADYKEEHKTRQNESGHNARDAIRDSEIAARR